MAEGGSRGACAGGAAQCPSVHLQVLMIEGGTANHVAGARAGKDPLNKQRGKLSNRCSMGESCARWMFGRGVYPASARLREFI